MTYFAVYYHSIIAGLYNARPGAIAIFQKRDTALEYAYELSHASNSKYTVQEITIKPKGKRGRPKK